MTLMKAIGYMLTLLTYGVYCFSRFRKEKKNMIVFDLFSKVISASAFFCLGSMSGFYSLLLSGCILILSYLKQRVNKKWHFIYVIFIAIYVTLFITNYEGISSIIIFISNIISITNNWYMPPQLMRIMGTMTSFTMLCFQISIKNYLGLLELVVITSNILSYTKYKRKNNKMKKE